MRNHLPTFWLLFLLAATGCADDASSDEAGTGEPVISDPADGTSGELGFLASCDLANDQCAAGLSCLQFTMKGPMCSHACATASDCASPSPGCNNKGYCKAP